MVIDTKYNFDELYYYNKMVTIPYIKKCDYCEDGKFKKPNGQIVDCPKCNGNGEYETGSGLIKQVTSKCVLSKINISIDEHKNKHIQYEFIDSDIRKKIFGTIYKDKESCDKDKKGVIGYDR